MNYSIKLTLAYDGTDFNGWQIQTNKKNIKTIQSTVENALKILYKKNMKIKSSSRTDAGVHALGYIAAYTPAFEIPMEKIPVVINNFLPDTIKVLKAKKVPKSFDPRREAKSKKYIYRVFLGDIALPFDYKYSAQIRSNLDVKKMQQAGQYFIGTHNFKAFTTSFNTKEQTSCEIIQFKIFNTKKYRYFVIKGNRFLHKMIRFMVGLLLEIGKENFEPLIVKELLKSGKRTVNWQVAEAKGLFLKKIEY
ncbi:tRNA pseudouridine(38-40) synthase TruA [bacterium]